VAVLVVGMHRSGTSAVTHVVEAFGLSVGSLDGHLTSDEFNRNGYFELHDVVALNDLLLERRGGWWDAPPDPPELGALGPMADDEMSSIRDLIARNFTGSRFVLKDPRISLLLPIWRAALEQEPSIVMVVRDPLDVARSLARRDVMSLSTGLGLWARYNTVLWGSLAGMRVHIVRFEDLMQAPAAVVGEVAESLLAWGEIETVAARPQASARVINDLGSRSAILEPPGVSRDVSDVRPFAEFLRLHVGRHDTFAPDPAPALADWTSAILTERREGRQSLREVEGRYAEEVRQFSMLEREHLRLRQNVDRFAAHPLARLTRDVWKRYASRRSTS
jgi:hypothetical protein